MHKRLHPAAVGISPPTVAWLDLYTPTKGYVSCYLEQSLCRVETPGSVVAQSTFPVLLATANRAAATSHLGKRAVSGLCTCTTGEDDSRTYSWSCALGGHIITCFRPCTMQQCMWWKLVQVTHLLVMHLSNNRIGCMGERQMGDCILAFSSLGCWNATGITHLHLHQHVVHDIIVCPQPQARRAHAQYTAEEGRGLKQGRDAHLRASRRSNRSRPRHCLICACQTA